MVRRMERLLPSHFHQILGRRTQRHLVRIRHPIRHQPQTRKHSRYRPRIPHAQIRSQPQRRLCTARLDQSPLCVAAADVRRPEGAGTGASVER